jgi:hypothetical protein
MRNLAIWLLVLVLECPVGVWLNIPEPERARIEMETIIDFCRKDMKMGHTKWEILRKVDDWKYQLHIIPLDQKI